LFGGYANNTDTGKLAVVNDLWHFEDGAWKQIETQGPNPGPRLCSAAAMAPNNRELLLFGGWDPQTEGTGGIILDDVWALDLASRRWSKLEAPMPGGPTSRHVAVSVPGVGIVAHTHRCGATVLRWDDKRRAFVQQPCTGSPPSSRGLHCAAAVGSDFIVFGGAAKDGTMAQDSFALDTNTWTWRELAPLEDGATQDSCTNDEHSKQASRPSARAGSAACAVGGMFIVAGGAERAAEGHTAGLVPRGDVWQLDIAAASKRSNFHNNDGPGSSKAWTLVADENTPNAPAPRNAHTLTHLGEGRVLCHGGWHPFVHTFRDSALLSVKIT
jgi:N-acetylneuraminic acid mutarotase